MVKVAISSMHNMLVLLSNMCSPPGWARAQAAGIVQVKAALQGAVEQGFGWASCLSTERADCRQGETASSAARARDDEGEILAAWRAEQHKATAAPCQEWSGTVSACCLSLSLNSLLSAFSHSFLYLTTDYRSKPFSINHNRSKRLQAPLRQNQTLPRQNRILSQKQNLTLNQVLWTLM